MKIDVSTAHGYGEYEEFYCIVGGVYIEIDKAKFDELNRRLVKEKRNRENRFWSSLKRRKYDE